MFARVGSRSAIGDNSPDLGAYTQLKSQHRPPAVSYRSAGGSFFYKTKQVTLRRIFYIVCGLTTSVIIATIYVTFECGQLLMSQPGNHLLGLLKLFATI
jgi:hypothetical protein